MGYNPRQEPSGAPSEQDPQIDFSELRKSPPMAPRRSSVGAREDIAKGFDWVDTFQNDIAKYLGTPKLPGGVAVYDNRVLQEQMRFAKKEIPAPAPYQVEDDDLLDSLYCCPPPKMKDICFMEHGFEGTLKFSSAFECGNLKFATMLPDKSYELYMSNDTNSIGHTQWYYFAVTGARPGQVVNFKIMNFTKKKLLYRKGKVPFCWSEKSGQGWQPLPLVNDHNHKTTFTPHTDPDRSKMAFCLSFSHKFLEDDTVFFAYGLPYSYSHHLSLLKSLTVGQAQEHAKVSRMCSSLGGNPCHKVVITDFDDTDQKVRKAGTFKNRVDPSLNHMYEANEEENLHGADLSKEVVVLMARQHPGETHGSWIMHGLIRFLVGSSTVAKQLRRRYIFVCIPMMNVDGVIKGNSRCSLAGVDLNRQWLRPDRSIHPIVFHTKGMMIRLCRIAHVISAIDFHGHSARRDVFFYGCPDREPEYVSSCDEVETKVAFGKTVKMSARAAGVRPKKKDKKRKWRPSAHRDVKVLPRLASWFGVDFSMSKSVFYLQRYKIHTARGVIYHNLGIDHCFTVEASMCGPSSWPNRHAQYDLPPETMFPIDRLDDALGKAEPGVQFDQMRCTTLGIAIAHAMHWFFELSAVDEDYVPACVKEQTGAEKEVTHEVTKEPTKDQEMALKQMEEMLANDSNDDSGDDGKPIVDKGEFYKQVKKQEKEAKTKHAPSSELSNGNYVNPPRPESPVPKVAQARANPEIKKGSRTEAEDDMVHAQMLLARVLGIPADSPQYRTLIRRKPYKATTRPSIARDALIVQCPDGHYFDTDNYSHVHHRFPWLRLQQTSGKEEAKAKEDIGRELSEGRGEHTICAEISDGKVSEMIEMLALAKVQDRATAKLLKEMGEGGPDNSASEAGEASYSDPSGDNLDKSTLKKVKKKLVRIVKRKERTQRKMPQRGMFAAAPVNVKESIDHICTSDKEGKSKSPKKLDKDALAKRSLNHWRKRAEKKAGESGEETHKKLPLVGPPADHVAREGSSSIAVLKGVDMFGQIGGAIKKARWNDGDDNVSSVSSEDSTILDDSIAKARAQLAPNIVINTAEKPPPVPNRPPPRTDQHKITWATQRQAATPREVSQPVMATPTVPAGEAWHIAQTAWPFCGPTGWPPTPKDVTKGSNRILSVGALSPPQEKQTAVHTSNLASLDDRPAEAAVAALPASFRKTKQSSKNKPVARNFTPSSSDPNKVQKGNDKYINSMAKLNAEANKITPPLSSRNSIDHPYPPLSPQPPAPRPLTQLSPPRSTPLTSVSVGNDIRQQQSPYFFSPSSGKTTDTRAVLDRLLSGGRKPHRMNSTGGGFNASSSSSGGHPLTSKHRVETVTRPMSGARNVSKVELPKSPSRAVTPSRQMTPDSLAQALGQRDRSPTPDVFKSLLTHRELSPKLTRDRSGDRSPLASPLRGYQPSITRRR